MKSITVKVLLSALIICAPMFGMAQERMNRGDMQKRQQEQRDKLKKDLKLSKKQAAGFDEVYKKYDKTRVTLMEKARSSGNREGMREKMGEMREKLNKDLKDHMNEKQFKKFTEIEKKNMERRRQGRGNRGGMGERGGRGGR